MWLALWLACAPARVEARPAPVAAAPPAPLPVWPAAGAPLTVLETTFPASWTPPRILVDAGHGAIGNEGNTGCNCQKEQDVTRRIQDAVVSRLAATGHIDARATRPDAAPVDYDTRIALADSWATAMISVHTDARASADLHLDPATGCRVGTGAAGFAVLWSDEGAPAEGRHRWADAIAARLREAGFPPYDGADYPGLYEGDPANPGVFVDRHEDNLRIQILRRTTTPTVIVETHEALDPGEVARWDEERTIDAFASALIAAIRDVAPER
jgi:N-acetylmuramoyl-L-alanine amidase